MASASDNSSLSSNQDTNLFDSKERVNVCLRLD